MACLVFLAIGLIWAQTSPPTGSQAQPPPPSNPSATPPAAQSSPVQSSAQPPSVQPGTQVNRLIMIDPAHGGTESGAVLDPAILEKDVTLALARRLRVDLGSHGFVTELVRDGDVNLSTDDRAAKINLAHPALYVCLHATSETGGIRIYSAILGGAADSLGPFADWNTAQFPFLEASRSAQQEMVAALQKSGMSARGLAAALQPLNNVTSPAVAVELAPNKSVSQLVAADYQQNVSAALANAIAQALSTPGANPGVAR